MESGASYHLQVTLDPWARQSTMGIRKHVERRTRDWQCSSCQTMGKESTRLRDGRRRLRGRIFLDLMVGDPRPISTERAVTDLHLESRPGTPDSFDYTCYFSNEKSIVEGRKWTEEKDVTEILTRLYNIEYPGGVGA